MIEAITKAMRPKLASHTDRSLNHGFERRIRNLVGGERLVTTEKYYLGLVDDGLRQRDQLCIFLGSRMPTILRLMVDLLPFHVRVLCSWLDVWKSSGRIQCWRLPSKEALSCDDKDVLECSEHPNLHQGFICYHRESHKTRPNSSGCGMWLPAPLHQSRMSSEKKDLPRPQRTFLRF